MSKASQTRANEGKVGVADTSGSGTEYAADFVAFLIRTNPDDKGGKVEVRALVGHGGDDHLPQPSREQLHRLARLEGSVQAWLDKAAPLSARARIKAAARRPGQRWIWRSMGRSDQKP
mgnify:CR=1 FL=1